MGVWGTADSKRVLGFAPQARKIAAPSPNHQAFGRLEGI